MMLPSPLVTTRSGALSNVTCRSPLSIVTGYAVRAASAGDRTSRSAAAAQSTKAKNLFFIKISSSIR